MPIISFNKKLSRREFIGGAAALGMGAALMGGAGRALAAMAPPPQGATATVPVLTINDPANFRILQVTDCHMNYIARGYLAEPEKIKSIKSMIAAFKPDIMVNTGDFWANVSGSAGTDTCKSLCKEFEKFKTPWAFAWGNHDESTDYGKTHETLEKAQYSLYRGGAADGNYRVEIRTEGSKEPLWNLIMLNDSRGGFKPEQIDWFNAEAGRIKKQTPAPPPAFLFFHIPLPQYNEAAISKTARGVKFESVCHEDGSTEAFGAFHKSGFVKSMFCGHDHINDYYGILQGMRLQYGRALGGYGKEKVRKGGTLITVNIPKGTFETKSVFPDGTSVTYDKLITQIEPGHIY